MKAFDKRKVPGLEDFSSESSNEDDIPLKKPCQVDDIEIELEVQENEFLKEDSINNTNNKSKKFNNVWGNVVQENMLDECFNKVGVNKMNVKRNVESYSIEDQDETTRKRKHSRKNNKQKCDGKSRNLKERITRRSYNKSKNRSHIQINPENGTQEEIVIEIARLLNEPKLEIIEKCISVLGKEKFLEFYYMTEDIESNGGLLVVNGSRRRTAGGVFLTLIKESDEIDEESKTLIFQNNGVSKPKPLEKDLQPQDLAVVSESDNLDNDMVSGDNIKNDNNDDEELEDGEII